MQFANILRSRGGMVLIYLIIAGCVATVTAVVMSNQAGNKPQAVAVDKPAAVDVTVNVPKGDTATVLPESGVVVVSPPAETETTPATQSSPPPRTARNWSHGNSRRRIASKQKFPAIPVFDGDRVEMARPDSPLGVHDVEQWSGNKKRVFAVPASLIRTDD